MARKKTFFGNGSDAAEASLIISCSTGTLENPDEIFRTVLESLNVLQLHQDYRHLLGHKSGRWGGEGGRTDCNDFLQAEKYIKVDVSFTTKHI